MYTTAYHLKNITKTYRNGNKSRSNSPVLKVIEDLIIPAGRITCFIGCSGSGKTTLLNILGLLDYPDEPVNHEDFVFRIGERNIHYENKRWKFNRSEKETFAQYRQHSIGYVFQDKVIPHNLKIKQLIRYLGNVNRRNFNDSQIKNQIERVKCPPDLINRYAAEVSKGEAQRIALALAMIKKPHIIIADEPTSNLDPHMGKVVMELIKNWVSESSYQEPRTVVWASHHLHQALNFADIIHVLKPSGELDHTSYEHQGNKWVTNRKNEVEMNYTFLANELTEDRILSEK